MGWARERWTDKFFSITLPAFAKEGLLPFGGKIWLPNLDCVEESIADFCGILSQYFEISYEKDPRANPLYLATEDVEAELLRCPDALTNVTQIRPLNNFSETPFCVLTRKSPKFETPVKRKCLQSNFNNGSTSDIERKKSKK